MTNEPKLPEPESTDTVVVSTSKDALRGLFRVISAKQNTLTEVFTRPILISIKDVAELHKQIADKLNHYELFGAEFSAVISFENNKHEEYGTWESFSKNEWNVPDVTESLVLKWDFLIKFPKATKPSSHTVTVRLSTDPNPFHVMQAVFSKDPEELDRLEIISAPMSCRVDFADNILSQELLTLISKWNEARRTPEISLPFLNKVKAHSNKVGVAIKYSIPILTAVACIAFYWKRTALHDPNALATAGLIRSTVLWAVFSSSIMFAVSLFAQWLSSYAFKHIKRFGRFTIFEMALE